MKIDNVSAISFDVFDTLIKRMTYSPKEVFDYVESELNVLFNCKTNFSSKRRDAKEKAYSKNRYYSLDDVYNEIDMSDSQKIVAIQLEKEIEIKLCYPNKTVRSLFDFCKQQKKRVFLISDMYLDRDTIEKMLTKCGIFGYEKLYISQEIKKEKMRGELFEFFLKENAFKRNKVIHIGDNNKSDILSAISHGIYARKVKETFNMLCYKNNSELKKDQKKEYIKLLRLLEANKPEEINEWQSIGYECLGPLLWGFSNWLAKKLSEEEIENVYFLAREGDIFKKAFELLHENQFNCYYLYVSRKSLIVPSFTTCKNVEEIIEKLSFPKNITVRQFYEAVGIDYSLAEKGIKKVGLDIDSRIDGWNIKSNNALVESFNYIWEEAMAIYARQNELLNKYLDQNHFWGKVAIVDIGWNGTMQSALSQICQRRENVSIYGYYLGLNKDNKLKDLDKADGYVYNPKTNVDFQYYLRGMSGPLEMMTTAKHGTTLKYDEKNKEIVPVLDKSEYFDETKKVEAEAITQMQDGGLFFVSEILKYTYYARSNINGRVAIHNFYQFGKNPKAIHRKMFYGLKEYDGTVGFVMLNPNAKGMKGENSLISGFWNSSWKIGYMKDKLILPLPYHKIYMWVKKRK